MGAAATVSLAGATLGSGEGLIKSISLACFFNHVKQLCGFLTTCIHIIYIYMFFIYISV